MYSIASSPQLIWLAFFSIKIPPIRGSYTAYRRTQYSIMRQRDAKYALQTHTAFFVRRTTPRPVGTGLLKVNTHISTLPVSFVSLLLFSAFCKQNRPRKSCLLRSLFSTSIRISHFEISPQYVHQPDWKIPTQSYAPSYDFYCSWPQLQ